MSEARRSVTSTQRLLVEYRGGGRDAERKLFERHRAALLDHARKQRWMRGLAKHATSEDLVGETFLRVLASGTLHSFAGQEEGALLRFLFKVLHDVAADFYRRHGRRKRGSGRPEISLTAGSDDDGSTPGPPVLPAVDTTPTSRARVNELESLCRAQLNEREWAAWRLCEMEDCTSIEAAARLGTSDAAVRGLVHRARQKILRVLVREVAETAATESRGSAEVRPGVR